METNKGVGCFIEYNNKFLILYRPQTQHQKNEWGLVGGKIDSGESPQQAIIREMAEEIGFAASEKDLEFLGNYNLHYPNSDWDFYTYKIQSKQPITLQLNTAECLDHKWVTPEECFSMPNLMDGLYVLLKEIGYIKDGRLS